MSAEHPSSTVLAETTTKALKFLGAASTNRAIRAILAGRGYDQQVHDTGWSLLLAACGYQHVNTPVDTPESRAAIVEIDAWDEPNFRIAAAALEYEFPAQYAFVFDHLEPQVGVAAVVSVSTFLDRLDALAASPDRAKTRVEDQAALDKLALRGITPEERKRLRGLLDVARGPSAAAPTAAPTGDPEALKAALLALYQWYVEWREVAHALIRRRDYLISLGLAARKPSKKQLEKQAAEKAAKEKAKEEAAAKEAAAKEAAAKAPSTTKK